MNSTRDTLPNFKKDRWHRDPSKYAGIVYLSPNPPQDSGTTIVIDGTPLEIENYYNLKKSGVINNTEILIQNYIKPIEVIIIGAVHITQYLIKFS